MSTIATLGRLWLFIFRMAETRKGGSFDRWLYRNYRQGSAVNAFVRQRVQPAAWLLMVGGGGSALMGSSLDQSIVILLTLFMFSLLCMGFIWAVFRRARISVIRSLPPTGSVGEELSYIVSVKNEGSWGLREVYLREAGDDPRPTEWEFTHLREPGEEDRNVFDRIFGFYRWKWLLGKGGSWQGLGSSERLDLAPGEVKKTSLSLLPTRRGLISLIDLRAELPDPLGLFQRRRPTLNEGSEVLIIPKRYRLPNLDLGGKSELKTGGDTASTVRGEGGEFMGLREYRAGDSLRKIHWKAWARTGQPIVKEFEETRFPRYGLVLDTSLKETGPDMLEEGISVAASFVATMEQESCLLDLMFVREEPEVFTAGRGVARVDRLMEVLARVEGSEEGGYESLGKLVLRYADEMTACVLVLSGWCPERKEFLGRLRASGMEVRVYVVGAGAPPVDDSLAGVHWLRWNHVQEDLMTQ